MISVMALIRTANELCAETMRGPLAELASGGASAEEIRGMVFNRIHGPQDETAPLDGIAQFFCPTISSGMSAAASGELDLAMGVPGHLIREMNPILCLQNSVLAPDRDAGFKRISLLRKHAELSTEAFQEEWFGLHAALVKRMPGLLGYRQNLVLDGPRDDGGRMMADGVVEIWAKDATDLDAAFASGAGRTVLSHAQEFIAESSSFVVEPTALRGLH